MAQQKTAENLKTPTEKAAFMLPRKLFFDDMPDKGLFAGTAALGFALIIILKVEAVGPELIAGLAVALMFAYGFIAYQIPTVHLRLDRLGDNFYYLGFIYTLASLSAALVQMRNGVEIDSVLGNFGIALITTIVGIAGRVVFVQMRSEIDDVEEVIRRDILEASAALKGQLSAALNDLDTFRTGLRQIAKETLEESVEYGKAHIHQIGAVAQQAADRIDAAFGERQSHAQEVLGLVLKISKATDKLLRRIETADLPTEQVVQRLDGFTGALETLLDRLRRSVQGVLDLSDARLKRKWWRFWVT
jgi:F0F1-type ATP synthase membrane subunit b/b'